MHDDLLRTFPRQARERIEQLLSSGQGAVVAGHFYRDLDGDGAFCVGDQLCASLLGLPTLAGCASPPEFAANCYWFAGVPAGGARRLSLASVGCEPFACEIDVRPGLNVVHVPIRPTRVLTYVVPHSHVDTEWVYTFEELLHRIEVDAMRQRIDLLEEQPQHVFCADEECVLIPMVARSAPRYRERLRDGIRDGLIEPKGLVTQTELTMPYGESLIRVMTLGERMLAEAIGEHVRPETFWSIDQYGFPSQLPQLMRKAGRRYFLIGEIVTDERRSRIPFADPRAAAASEFWLEGPDGSRVLAHRANYSATYWGLAPNGPQYSPVGAHGSALNLEGSDNVPPDRNLLDKLRTLNATRNDACFIASTSVPFFRAVEHDSAVPVVHGDSHVVYWAGIYESRAAARLNNRRLENALLATETLAAIALLEGLAPVNDVLDRAWHHTLLNQHHDPLMSPMAVPGLFETAMPARTETAAAYVEAARVAALNGLVVDIRNDEQPGNAVVVFNPSVHRDRAVVEVDVPVRWDAVDVVTGGGRSRRAQVLARGHTTRIAFEATDLPAVGWAVYYVRRREGSAEDADCTASANHLENRWLRVELADGRIVRIVDRERGIDVLRADASAGINEVTIWRDEGCISVIRPANHADEPHFVRNPAAALVARANSAQITTRVVASGPARAVVELEFALEWGRFVQRLTLDADSRTLAFRTTVDWEPAGRARDFDGRRVRLAFRSADRDNAVWCDAPFEVLEWAQGERVRPVNSWLAMQGRAGGVALFHGGQPSVQVVDDTLYATLFRSVTEPGDAYNMSPASICGWDHGLDEALEDGVQVFDYALHVYDGTWSAARVPQAAAAWNSPLWCRAVPRHVGPELGRHLHREAPYMIATPGAFRDPRRSCLQFVGDLVVSAVKPAEFGRRGVVVRAWNPRPEAVVGALVPGVPHAGVEETDFSERTVAVVAPRGGRYELCFGPCEIKTLLVLMPE